MRLTKPQADLLTEIIDSGVLYVTRNGRYYRTVMALVWKGYVRCVEPDYSALGKDGYSAVLDDPAERS